MLKSKKPKAKDLEQIVGICVTLFNGLNGQAKEMFTNDDRAVFLAHLSTLCSHEAGIISSPVSDLIKDGENDG